MKIKILEILRSKLAQWLLREAPRTRGVVFDLKIDNHGKQWLRKNYPSLKIGKDKNGYIKIVGLLEFDMLLSSDKQSYVIKPATEHLTNGERIQDEYQIEIIFKTSQHSNLPQVYEKSGRIESTATAKNLNLSDLHINPDGAACLCLNIKERNYLPDGFNLPDFFHNLIIPFFYGQSYFEKYGDWPWEEYGHGICGLLEEWHLQPNNATKEEIEKYLEHLKKRREWQSLQELLASKKKVKGHHSCVCGSSKKFRNCHKRALLGLWRLKKDIENFNVDIQ